MNSQRLKEWHIKLKVSYEEERRIKKEAIDHDMRVAEYIKSKILSNPPVLVERK